MGWDQWEGEELWGWGGASRRRGERRPLLVKPATASGAATAS